MLKSKTILIIISLVVFKLSGQGGFRKRINLPGSNGSYAMASYETSPGNYLIISKTQKNQGNNLILTLDLTKYNSITNSYTTLQLGDTNCNFSGYSNFLHIRNISKRIDNAIYLANFIKSNSQNSYTEGLFLKLNLNGDTVWKKKYTSINEHVFLFQSNKCLDGGFLLCGCVWNVGLDISQLLLIKTDANGNELWRKKYNNPSPNYAEGRDVIEDSATKNILLTGMRFKGFSNGSQISERFVTMFDSLGNIKYDLPNSYMMSNPSWGITKDKNNNYYIHGFKNKNYIAPYFTSQAYITKFKVVGNSLQILFDNEYGKELTDNIFTSLSVDEDNNLHAFGTLDTNILNNILGNVMIQKYKLNSNGLVLKTKTYNYQFNNYWLHGINSWGASLTSDGGIIASVARIMNNANNYAPVFFVKYDSTGCDTSAFYCATVDIKENYYQAADVSIYPQPANNV
ncbi:MAG: hypothetical protein IM592_03225, partial [Bacteroidetes bacterium]|nr:hypothetical protein [Bacteroidota bacterium]